MAAPKEIVELVDRFENNLASYKSGHYNETQVRREFVDPFFKALGWDVDNEQGFAEAYKDVIHEDAVKVGTTTKAPDYSFRIGGQRKFFLEAKKPSVDIKDDIHPAFQLRRYAWTMKLPLSVLTDFEEFAVYDCNVKPDKTDKASNARIFYLNYKDYLTRWDEITGIFSKNAVLKGSFDKYAADKKSKRGTSAVDVVFLEEIAGWRELLARNIALRNPDLSTKDLNYAVQAIVNRIVFLRICEDRGIERLMKLQDLLNGERVYPRLCELFRRADERYNSGIFHFEKEPSRESPDTLTLSLNIDDKPLKEIFKRLYYPDSPYEFSVLPAEILGQVYEQFLGKVIRLTEGHRAVIEDKPEVKKAGGVKYTPVYIVENIVGNTLGKILKGKTPLEVVLITVLDPACGSGSFLIVAYQYLLDWHRDWYVQNLVPLLQSGLKPSSPEIRRLLPGVETGKKGRKKEPELPVYQGRGGEWRLTTAERKRILLNNIYGVDIDHQAVEVTKLSLLLKVLEGENDETISKQLKLFQERALPDLSNNIKCGNSLIGWNILKDNPGLTQEEIDRINPFDWDKEFPDIMQAGGFHVIIGNPPYVRIQVMKEWAPVEVEHYKQKYASASKGNYDIYVVFVEKGLSLLNEHGRLGFILPHKFFNVKYGQPLRELIARGKNLSEIVHFGDQQVFSGATTYTCLLFLNKAGSNSFLLKKVDDLSNWRSTNNAIEGYISSDSVTGAEWTFQVGSSAALFDKLSKMPFKLSDIAERIFQGIIPGADKVYAVKLINLDSRRARCFSRALNAEVDLEPELLRKIVSGAEVGRFVLRETNERVIYPYYNENNNAILISPEELRQKFPLTYEYFQKNSDLLDMRDHGSAKGPERHKYIRRQNIELQPMKKLAVPRLVSRLHAGFDKDGDFCLDNVDVGGIMLSQGISYHYILGLLNSNLINFYFIRNTVPFRGGFFSANRQFIENLPIRTIDSSNHQDVTRHDRIISLVDSMLSFNKQLLEARTPHEQITLQRQIEATDDQIDALVYELYGLTEEEIKIVERM